MNRYKNTPIYSTNEGILYNRNLIFPQIPESSLDTYVITTAGDRFDTLALTYYGDSTLWWIIAGANNRSRDSLNITPGVQLRIPMNTDLVIKEYEKLNANR